MGVTDRFRSIVRAIVGLPDDPGSPPWIDRLALYRAQVMAASSDGSTLDVQPEDPRIPGAKNVPVRVGIPGAVAVVSPGGVVLLGWERGDPSRPYAVPSWESGVTVTTLTLNANMVYLGSQSGAEALVKKSDFDGHTHPAGTLVAPAGTVGGPVTGVTGGAPSSAGTSKVKAA